MKTLNGIASQISKAQLAAEIAKATATAKCRIQLDWYQADYIRGSKAYAEAIMNGAEPADADKAAAQAIHVAALRDAGITPFVVTPPPAKPALEDTATMVARLVAEALAAAGAGAASKPAKPAKPEVTTQPNS